MNSRSSLEDLMGLYMVALPASRVDNVSSLERNAVLVLV